jgi:NadR type nicotinamide-nucleotide adenylyltransferase
MESLTRRSDSMIRVVLTGSESTGKTTLARRLALEFNAPVVPEFVRDFASSKASPIEFADHGPIARGQVALEDEYSARSAGGRLMIQDTDLLSTVVYCSHYFGSCPAWIRQLAAERRPTLYLLLDIDVPWVADDVRDRGHMREEMQRLFRDALAGSGAPHTLVTGDWDDRFESARAAVARLL